MSDERLSTPPEVPPQVPPAVPPPVPPPGPNLYLNPAVAGPYFPNAEERNMAMLAHLLGLFTGFIGPLVIWLVKKDESHYVTHHGKESLNFQLTFLIVMISAMSAGIVIGFLTLGLGFFLLFSLVVVGQVFAIIWIIQCCIAANRGEWCRYPISIRMIP